MVKGTYYMTTTRADNNSIFLIQNTSPTLYIDELLELGSSGLSRTRSEVRRLNEPDVDLYLWINNEGIYNGRAYQGTACDNKWHYKTSLTKGPSRGVVETAEVLSCHTKLFSNITL